MHPHVDAMHMYVYILYMHLRHIYDLICVFTCLYYLSCIGLVTSCCLVTKLLHLFVWLTACWFICMYDCCLSIHFFCITDLSLTSLFSDWLVFLFILFFPSFDESWVACASTNKIRTYTTYKYNIQLTVNLSQKMTRVFASRSIGAV